MSAGRPLVQSAAFIPAEGGPRFRLVTGPAEGAARGTVVFVHAFAEEMNKSRRMVARTARALAADGWRVVQRDLLGCGDSAGDFGDATWAAWLGDLRDELQSAGGNDGPLWLWCMRGGALLAAPLLQAHPALNLLLWQPVASGAQHLQQFLRLGAGSRIAGTGKAEGVPPLQRLRAGESVEVAGYEIHPQLASGMSEAALRLPEGHRGRVLWCEVSADEPPSLSLPGQRFRDEAAARGLTVECAVVSGPPFWQTQEIEDCDALADATLRLLNGPVPVADRPQATEAVSP